MTIHLSPRQLTVLTTSQCTAKCGHCSMNSGPERRERLDFATIRAAIDGLMAIRPLSTVIFAGGEPTLMGNTLLDAIAYVDSLRLNSRIVTNASWAVSEKKARAKLDELRSAGLRELNISADDHHLPFIPFANVERAWHAARGMGFDAVVIANCYGPASTVTPDWIEARLGETLPRRFDDAGSEGPLSAPSADGTVYALSNSFMQKLGRAHSDVAASKVFFPDRQSDLSGGCPWALQSPALSPRGHLVACCGIEAEDNPVLDLGDLAAETVAGIVARADDSVLVNAIARLGPAFLKTFVERRRPDIAFRRRYSSVCEICEDVVTRAEVRDALAAHRAELALHVLAARRQSDGARPDQTQPAATRAAPQSAT